MEINNLLEFSDRKQLHAWLQTNHATEKECWVVAFRSKLPQRQSLDGTERTTLP